MAYTFYIEPASYYAFEDEAAQLKQCKEWGLLSEKAAKTKTFFYKGNGMNATCTIVGFADKITAVIEFEDGRRHCIHPAYLKEMQAANYGQKSAAAAEDSAEAADGADGLSATGSTEASENSDTDIGAAPENDVSAGEPTADGHDEAVQAEPESESEPDAGTVWEDAEPSSVTKSDAASDDAAAPAEQPAKTKGKKEKAPKLQLPEEKVKMTAIVQEFTTVPNNFSDNDDEVIIYEAVSILDPAVELGTAWSSNSATLKKLELGIGDTIVFEAKVVAKKLTKHPVPYKINNPSKIQKGQA
ncbi:hypothetical protein ACFFNY_19825 [Paenibacillus hodogayensis]|uniref:Uncharacterized protein n=1 Tax=Paenibacillus hodogayensis TaxID=279208 RepID=A0ABV5VZU7_9BACL